MKATSLFVFVTAIVFLYGSAQGFTLNLKMHNASTTKISPTCQVVCEDTGSRPPADRPNLTSNGDTMHSKAAIDNDGPQIARMSLFSSSANGKSLLAEVSTTKNLITKDDGTLSIEGILTSDQATIRVDLFNFLDCQQDFMCQIIMVDGQMNILTTAKSECDKEVIAGDLAATSDQKSDVTSDLLSILVDLKAEVAILNTKVGEIPSVEQRLTAQVASAERRQVDALSYAEQRLTTKMSDIDRNAQLNCARGLSQIEAKLDSALQQADKDVLFSESLVSFLKEDMKQIATYISGSLSHNVSVMNANLSDTVKDVWLKFDNVSSGLENNLVQVLDSVVALGQKVENTSSKQDISYFTETVREEITNISCLADEDQSILKHSQCKKGMLPITAPPSYPYPVFYPDKSSVLDLPFLCDTSTNFGGWILIHRRSTGNVVFLRDWEEYKAGFGSLDDDFWLGLEAIYKLTSRSTFELRIDLKYKGNSAYALYSTFHIGSEADNYRLHVGSYSGTAGDSLSGNFDLNGLEFTTKDRDHDLKASGNCAIDNTGAWWYRDCHRSNLNGRWLEASWKGLVWHTFTGIDSVSFAEMKIRRTGA